jgi:flagellar basal body-associated protein FliL
MTRILFFVVVLAIAASLYIFYFSGEDGVLGAGSYEEAREEFSNIRPPETVWQPEEEEEK